MGREIFNACGNAGLLYERQQGGKKRSAARQPAERQDWQRTAKIF